MAQVVARLNDDLVAAVDDLVSEGVFESRSDAIRRALEFVVDAEAALVSLCIIAGYQRIPKPPRTVGRGDRSHDHRRPW
jgi:Arc/MetJ-type ribon-helix-helix transcriptional regulator